MVLEASGLSKAKDVEELRKQLSKKRKTVDLVLLVEGLQQTEGVDVARELGAKMGAQLLNAAVPVLTCGHVQVNDFSSCICALLACCKRRGRALFTAYFSDRVCKYSCIEGFSLPKCGRFCF